MLIKTQEDTIERLLLLAAVDHDKRYKCEQQDCKCK